MRDELGRDHRISPLEQVTVGFALVKCPVADFTQIHQHNDVEVSLLTGGEATVWFGQSRRLRLPDKLGICWGALPHGRIEVTRGEPVGYSIHVPLPQFISWQFPPALVGAVLHGQFIVDREQCSPCSDQALMENWHDLLQQGDAPAQEIVVREVQTRLLRLARSAPAADAPVGSEAGRRTDRSTAIFERMLAEIHAHHHAPLTIEQIARAAGVSPTHAMHVFRVVCGMGIHSYLIGCRIYTAQRLLVTTPDKISAIAWASGFRSIDCFYDAFHRVCGMTPKQYRMQVLQ